MTFPPQTLPGNRQDAMVRAIGMSGAGQNAGFFGGFQNYRASAITEQNAGGAIIPVENP